ncbi:hypothetical protein CJ030_MR3G009893 [Morella rubra]|uniref:RNase H type-1 domain-containing protein n=1 Tax=Morella rubra TaxID=262757 RepID=A0A6A1W6B6_9ROSI|nr:hypothetical protein CJ030_MR3G009893 [Morella rubra]
MITDVARRYESHQLAWGTLQQEEKRIWKPPDTGQLKINYDVAVAENYLCIAAICHNSLGHILMAKSNRMVGGSPIKGEARAARLACQMAALFDGQGINIEGDCLNLVTQVQDEVGALDWDISGEVVEFGDCYRTMLSGDLFGSPGKPTWLLISL